MQIRETAKRLKQRGHDVEIQNSNRPEVGNADLVHVFNSRVQAAFPSQMATCQASGRPVVVSPIWINLGKALWGSRGALPVLRKAVQEGEARASHELELLRSRKLVVGMEEGGVLEAHGFGTYNADWHEQIPALLGRADGLLPNMLRRSRQVLRVVETLDLDYYAVRLPVCAAAMGPRGPQSSLAAWAALEEAALCRDANGEQRCSEQPLVPRYRSTLPMIA